MDWLLIASVFWKVCLGILLLVVSVLAGYICGTLASIRNSVESIRNTLKSTEGLIDKQLTPLLGDASQTIKTINDGLPEMLENVNRLTAHVYQVSESEIQPTVRCVQEITATVNRNVGRLDELFNMLGDFSQQTVKRAGSYRDQFTRPITDFISVWSALKAGWQVCSRLLRPNMAQSSNSSEGSHHEETQNE